MKEKACELRQPSTSGSPSARCPICAPPLDESVLLQLRRDYGDDDGSLLLELVAAFVDAADMFECAATLPESVLQQTPAGRAQQLRGAAVMVGAQNVATLCHQLEAAERTGDELTSSQLLPALSVAIAHAKTALERVTGRVATAATRQSK